MNKIITLFILFFSECFFFFLFRKNLALWFYRQECPCNILSSCLRQESLMTPSDVNFRAGRRFRGYSARHKYSRGRLPRRDVAGRTHRWIRVMLERANNKPILFHREFRHSITRRARSPPRGFIEPASIPMLPSRVAGPSAEGGRNILFSSRCRPLPRSLRHTGSQ